MTKQKQKEKTLSLDLLTRVAPIFVNVFIIAKERRKSIIDSSHVNLTKKITGVSVRQSTKIIKN